MMGVMGHSSSLDLLALKTDIKRWGKELGFQSVGVSGVELGDAAARLERWLAAGMHGEMDYMAKHGAKRARPELLVPGTQAVVSASMNYRATSLKADRAHLRDPLAAYVSRYALGRDYHKVLRQRLQRLTRRIEAAAGACGARVFCDSAPVMETELATRAGLGWRGKHGLVLERAAGSFFFLGEIHLDLPLPPDAPVTEHCGSCRACLDACPTRAIVAPYVVDARRCISYLTIEAHGPIPVALRRLMGNRVYGCDDCQLCCPWNRFARPAQESDFAPRAGLESAHLLELFAWDAETFDTRLAGSAIRRIGHARWLRNLAVGLGNAPYSPAIVSALQGRTGHPSELVREHVAWALGEQQRKAQPAA